MIKFKAILKTILTLLVKCLLWVLLILTTIGLIVLGGYMIYSGANAKETTIKTLLSIFGGIVIQVSVIGAVMWHEDLSEYILNIYYTYKKEFEAKENMKGEKTNDKMSSLVVSKDKTNR